MPVLVESSQRIVFMGRELINSQVHYLPHYPLLYSIICIILYDTLSHHIAHHFSHALKSASRWESSSFPYEITLTNSLLIYVPLWYYSSCWAMWVWMSRKSFKCLFDLCHPHLRPHTVTSWHHAAPHTHTHTQAHTHMHRCEHTHARTGMHPWQAGTLTGSQTTQSNIPLHNIRRHTRWETCTTSK